MVELKFISRSAPHAPTAHQGDKFLASHCLALAEILSAFLNGLHKPKYSTAL